MQLAIGVDCLRTIKSARNRLHFAFIERHRLRTRAAPQQIERSVDSCTGKISLWIARPVIVFLAFDEAEEDGLKHVFGVSDAARNPLCRPKNSAVVCLEKVFQFAGGLVYH